MAAPRPILKYSPAVVLGLLVAIWFAGCFFQVQYRTRVANSDVWLVSGYGSASFFRAEANTVAGFSYGVRADWAPAAELRYVLGRWGFDGSRWRENGQFWVRVPLPLCMTALLPLAVGPFTAFRFRLWQYLAYTSLVALELAYYLRWQP